MWKCWLCIIFFGLGYFVGFFNLFDRRPQIIINEYGIYDRTFDLGVINWKVIKNAYLKRIYRQKFICLVIDEKYKPLKKKGLFHKAIVRFNVAIGAQEINLYLGHFRIDYKKLTDFILQIINSEYSGQDKKEIIEKYVA